MVDVILSNEFFEGSVFEFSIRIVTDNAMKTQGDVILFGAGCRHLFGEINQQFIISYVVHYF